MAANSTVVGMLDLHEQSTNEHFFETDNNLKRAIDKELHDVHGIKDQFKEHVSKVELNKLTEKVNKLPEMFHLINLRDKFIPPLAEVQKKVEEFSRDNK